MRKHETVRSSWWNFHNLRLGPQMVPGQNLEWTSKMLVLSFQRCSRFLLAFSLFSLSLTFPCPFNSCLVNFPLWIAALCSGGKFYFTLCACRAQASYKANCLNLKDEELATRTYTLSSIYWLAVNKREQSAPILTYWTMYFTTFCLPADDIEIAESLRIIWSHE